MTLAGNLLYTVVPAAIGVLIAVALLVSARRDVTEATPELNQRLVVLAALPLTAVLFAVVAAVVASNAPEPPTAPLAALGGAAFVQATLQGYVGSRGLPRLAADPAALGKTIAMAAAPEVLTIGALVWVLLSVGEAAPVA